jgi:hypothetical protein
MNTTLRAISIAVVTLSLTASVKAQDLTLDQMRMAETIYAAIFAADACPGLHLIRGSLRANADSVGLTPKQAASTQWRDAMLLGHINAKEGYGKNPAAFCDRMWHFLGPDHPGMIPHTMLTRD